MIDSLKHVWHILGWCISHTVAGVRKLIDYHVLLIIVLIAMTACLFSVMFDINNAVMAFKAILGTPGKKETIEFIAFGMGGIIAAIVAVAVSRRAEAQEQNNMLIEKGHVNERLKSTIDNLGHIDASVRIASFYQFYHLAKEGEKDFRHNIFEILCSCLRCMDTKRSHLTEEDGKERPTAECQTLLNILFRNKHDSALDGFEPDLRRSYLIRANLRHAYLSNANFTRAHLIASDLMHANLMEADFTNADLSGADLSRANLAYANLTGANLASANLIEADLTSADLTGAYLIGAHIDDANFTNAKFESADLSDTDFRYVNSIEKADFSWAKTDGKLILRDEIPTDKGRYIAPWTNDEFWAKVGKK